MSEKTGISWTDATFNPWWGCQKVSHACDHCYAERDAKRFAAGRVLWGVSSERRIFDVATKAGEKHWAAPLNWAKTMPTKLGRRPRVFCASMGDWLDLDAPMADFVRLLDLIRRTPELDWLLLSKRIGNFEKRLRAARDEMPYDKLRDLWLWITEWYREGNPPENVWIGTTVIDQAEADRDIPKLLAVPAEVRFVSIEPMLGPIDLRFAFIGGPTPSFESPLHWVIAGGESGPHARPSHPDWFRSLRDQCAAAGVPLHFKQWGEWVPEDQLDSSAFAASRDFSKPGPSTVRVHRFEDGKKSVKYGKAAAGRQLDGVTHDAFPE